MEAISGRLNGIKTPHSTQYCFARTEGSDSMGCYLLMYFRTPFLYGDREAPRRGEAGQYLLYPPQSTAFHASVGEGFVNDWLFFEGGAGLIGRLGLPLSTPFSAGGGIMEPYLLRIGEEQRLRAPCHREMIEACITELLIALSRGYRHGEDHRHSAYGVLCAAREQLLSHPEEKTSLSDIAAGAGYSVSRFCVLYRTFFGLPPIEELIRVRLDRAAALLRYGGISVTAAAERCGFSSLHYFSRRFKERYGVPPSQYME